MRAYEVSLNGRRLCTAGIGKNGYVSAYVTYVSERNETGIDVVGLVSRKKIYVRWTRRPLHTGDEIKIKIVNKKTADKFKKIIGHVDSPDRVLELRKRMVRKMAKEFGWKILQTRKNNRD